MQFKCLSLNTKHTSIFLYTQVDSIIHPIYHLLHIEGYILISSEDEFY